MKATKRLVLHRTTVRDLNATELQTSRGGIVWTRIPMTTTLITECMHPCWTENCSFRCYG
ncbi:MAG: hypothetical protein R3B81_13900 [bacterium]